MFVNSSINSRKVVVAHHQLQKIDEITIIEEGIAWEQARKNSKANSKMRAVLLQLLLSNSRLSFLSIPPLL